MPTQPNPQIVTEAIDQSHDILRELCDCKVLSNSAYDEINAEVDEFFRHLGEIAQRDSEKYWTSFRSTFGFAREPVTKQVIPMNAANLCPEPTPFLSATNRLRDEYNRNVAQQTRMGNGVRVRQMERARKGLALGLGLPPGQEPGFYNRLAIVRNASEGNNAISCGYRKWKVTTNPSERDNVVLWKENHPTNLTAWQLRAGWTPESPEQSLFEIREVEFDLNDSDDDILKAFTDAIDEKTRFVSYSHTSNGSGFRIPEPVRQGIWNTASGLDCHVHVDGTMEFGAASIDLKYCHSFVSSCHKWFLGPKQTGVLYVSETKVENFEPSIFAYNYKIEVPEDWRDFPEMNPLSLRFEMLGQRDDVDIIALSWKQQMWNVLIENGRRDRKKDPYQRVTTLATHLKDELREKEWDLITPIDKTRSRGVVRVKAPRRPNTRNESLYDYIYRAHRIAGSGGGSTPDQETFRLCPHIYNSIADVDNAILRMNQWRAQAQ